MSNTTTDMTRATDDSAEERFEVDADLALEGEARRAYDEAWRDYKRARSRFMDMVLNGGDDVPVEQRIGHDDLTRMERDIILAEREQRARSAWELLQDAQFNYMLAVDPSVEVEPRKP